jgi:hypothetical protein
VDKFFQPLVEKFSELSEEDQARVSKSVPVCLFTSVSISVHAYHVSAMVISAFCYSSASTHDEPINAARLSRSFCADFGGFMPVADAAVCVCARASTCVRASPVSGSVPFLSCFVMERKSLLTINKCVKSYNALSGNTASVRSGPSICQRVLYPHPPFGHVARLAGTRGLQTPAEEACLCVHACSLTCGRVHVMCLYVVCLCVHEQRSLAIIYQGTYFMLCIYVGVILVRAYKVSLGFLLSLWRRHAPCPASAVDLLPRAASNLSSPHSCSLGADLS